MHWFPLWLPRGIKIIYESDPESPFSKIVVKKGSSVVGAFRRNSITGHYHFYDNQRDVLNCLFQDKRTYSMKMRIEGLLDLSEAG